MFMQTCAQYNVELRQNCTKTVDLTTVGKMDNLRTYQRMFMMTQKEINFLYEQFKRLDSKNLFSLSKVDLLKDLTVFGYNYPPEYEYFLELEEKENIRIFLEKWDAEVTKILKIDKDTNRCSFDEFLLLFVRQQSNLDWNKLLPRYYKDKKNYLLNDVSETVISSRFKPVPPENDPRFATRGDKLARPKLNLQTKEQHIYNLKGVIKNTYRTISNLEKLNLDTQNKMKLQLETLTKNYGFNRCLLQ